MDNLDRMIHDLVLRIAREKSPEVACVDNDHRLAAGLGLDSLDIARLVAVLELKVGADPFAKLVSITDVRTVGDLCAAYRIALSAPVEADAAPSFATQVKRAEARRSAQAQPSSEPQE
jgi:acyl carrier protein